MSDNARQSFRPPVNLKGLQERVLLSTALMRYDAQLRNFTPLRDRLVASGQDANAAYRHIESRRDYVMAELEKLTPAPVHPAAPTHFSPPHPGSVLSLPIAPARFDPPRNNPWFGYSGSVQMGRAHEGNNIFPPEIPQLGPSGSVFTRIFGDNAAIYFGGQLDGGTPVDGHPKENFWLHSWIFLIPFPAPVGGSTLTYSFRVPIQVTTLTASGAVTFWCFVSVGETPDFVGQEVVVNTPDSFPLVADLYGPNYQVLGQSNVQRSFFVGGSHVPAVAVALGVVVALDSGARVHFDEGTSLILPFSDAGVPGVVNFRYDPTPPENSPG